MDFCKSQNLDGGIRNTALEIHDTSFARPASNSNNFHDVSEHLKLQYVLKYITHFIV